MMSAQGVGPPLERVAPPWKNFWWHPCNENKKKHQKSKSPKIKRHQNSKVSKSLKSPKVKSHQKLKVTKSHKSSYHKLFWLTLCQLLFFALFFMVWIDKTMAWPGNTSTSWADPSSAYPGCFVHVLFLFLSPEYLFLLKWMVTCLSEGLCLGRCFLPSGRLGLVRGYAFVTRSS